MKEECKIKTSIGGQALIEGVMMRGPKKTVAAVWNADGKLETKDFSAEIKARPKWMRLPLIRGVVSFIDSMKLGYTTQKCLREPTRSRKANLISGWKKPSGIN